MFRKKEDMVAEIREKMRGGAGEVEILHILKKEDTKGKIRLFAKILLKNGCSIGFHTHETEDEVFYILSGTATVNDAGKDYTAIAGDVIVTGNGAGHSIGNAGEEPLEVLAVILLYQ
jgi:mannose-6-phosphate isomerase-like protein (cupin superfamily)